MDPANVELVVFHHSDPESPKNWSPARKRFVVATTCTLCFTGVIGSSLYSPSESLVVHRYGISETVNSLGLSLFVLGFALGPLICPVSEIYGRRIGYLIAWPLLIIFSAPSAFVHNAAVILIFRLFAGVAAGVNLAVGPALLADMYSGTDLQALGIATSFLVLAAFTGPVVGPVIGFFITAHAPKELWTLRVQFFLAIASLPLVLLLPETHLPTILARRAKKMRKLGNSRAFAHHELHRKTPSQLVREAIIRPLHMMVTEPIVIGSAIWTALSYGILYFSFEAYPVIFLQQHKIPFQLGGLMFLPIMIGMILGVVPYVPVNNFFMNLKLPKWMGEAGPETPEARLKLSLFSCICLPVSSFWLAWSSGPETHWVVPLLSGVVFGYANVVIFFTFTTYTAHSYTLFTASSGAASVFARSVIGAAFPLFSHKVLEHVGTKWGVSIFGFCALALFPIPLIYLRHGPALRKKSPYIQEALELSRRMEAEKKAEEGDEDERKSQDTGVSGTVSKPSTMKEKNEENDDMTDTTTRQVDGAMV